MNTLVRLLIATAALLGTALAHAVHLGDLRGSSALGEPFAASIPLYAPSAGELNGATVEVIADPLFARQPGMRAMLDSLYAELVQDSSGAYITVRSRVAVNELVLAFRVKLSNGTQSVSRAYSAIIDPSPRSIATRRPVAAPAAASTATSGARSYGPVRPGETLWKIASSIGKRYGGSTSSIMTELVDANPQAFIGGDMNRLIAGATLQLPDSIAGTAPAPQQSASSAASARAPSVAAANSAPAPRAAPAVTSTSTSTTTTTTTTTTTSAVTPAPAVSSTQATATTPAADGSPVAVTSARSGARRKVDWRENKPELARRLADMDAKFAALRERYGAGGGAGTTRVDTPAAAEVVAATVTPAVITPVAAAVVNEAAAEASATVAEQAPASRADTTTLPTPAASADAVIAETADANAESADAIEPAADAAPAAAETAAAEADPAPTVASAAAPAVAAVAPAPVRSPVTAAEQSGGFVEQLRAVLALIPFKLIAYLALAGLALWAAARGVGVYLKRNRAETAERVHHDLEAERRAEVARKARLRLDLEAEVRRIVDDHEDTKAKLKEAGLQELTAEAASDLEGSLTEIDMSITHGRYQRAEMLLKEVISEAPRNTAARLRLAEVYYITERVKEFVNEVHQLRDSHRDQISDSDWQKLMRMGKVAAPDEPLFGGLSTVPGDQQQA